jgi:dTDP-4-amino-4,6-dideoxy-D-galactose acyltransferase
MQVNTIEPLEWDSHFFGYPVAKISLDQDGSNHLENLFQQLESNKVRLTYFFVPPAEQELSSRLIEKGSALVDQKAVYSKATEKHTLFTNNIIEFEGTEINERLTELVLMAGIFSRFRLDENFTNKEYERLYTEWLSKSIKKTIAFKTLVAKKGSELIGITTLGEKSNHADIGLVAVDGKYKGQGIGYNLIQTADDVAFDMGFKEIKVVTQLKNIGACRLYEKCNFRIECITNIYHYWK